jgi:hypothetical protein
MVRTLVEAPQPPRPSGAAAAGTRSGSGAKVDSSCGPAGLSTDKALALGSGHAMARSTLTSVVAGPTQGWVNPPEE